MVDQQPAQRTEAALADSWRLLDQRLVQLSTRLHSAEQDRDREAARSQRLGERLEGVLNLLPGGVVVLDGQGLVTDANPAALAFLGEPLIGQLWQDVVHRAFAPRADDGHEVSLADGRRLKIATQPMPSGPGQLVLLTDLTETRALQAEVSRNERLSSMGRMLAGLAHQLRTPLSTAMLYAGQLSIGEITDQQRQRFAGKLKQSLKHLERQIRDMLLFARGDITLSEVVSSAELLELVAETARVVLEPATVQCQWQNKAPSSRVACNADVLAGALVNLLTNAVQAAADAPVTIRVEVKDSGEHLRLAVRDNGPGVAQEHLARIEEPFFTTKAQGTGLGLAVVRAVARAHGGQFRLTRNPDGVGMCAALDLPLAAPAVSPRLVVASHPGSVN